MVDYKKIICIIDKEHYGKRLDIALTNLSINISRTQIKSLIVKGKIKKSNVVVSDPAYKVKINEKYEILIEIENKDQKNLPQNIPIKILYEDKDIIVLDKESGIVVHPSPGNEKNTLVNALLHHTKNKLSEVNKNNRPGIVHRLDKDTSGIIIIAKNNSSHINLAKQFKEHTIKRKYFALVWGLPIQNSIKGFIGRHKINRKKMAMVEERYGRYSETIIKIKKKYSICSLIECELKTGRTHQVRVHMNSVGSPIIGDKVYGKKIKFEKKLNKERTKLIFLNSFSRQALHAYFIGFKHPKTGEYKEFISNLPQDFSELLENISKY
tara:strand:+ start:14119 stop:15090 length:972 start_codon:yes stop_codon:yes gene_type:complete